MVDSPGCAPGSNRLQASTVLRPFARLVQARGRGARRASLAGPAFGSPASRRSGTLAGRRGIEPSGAHLRRLLRAGLGSHAIIVAVYQSPALKTSGRGLVAVWPSVPIVESKTSPCVEKRQGALFFRFNRSSIFVRRCMRL